MGERSKINNSQKEEHEIPVEGSLGLLAYGDKGLKAWRKARDKEKNKDAVNAKKNAKNE